MINKKEDKKMRKEKLKSGKIYKAPSLEGIVSNMDMPEVERRFYIAFQSKEFYNPLGISESDLNKGNGSYDKVLAKVVSDYLKEQSKKHSQITLNPRTTEEFKHYLDELNGIKKEEKQYAKTGS